MGKEGSIGNNFSFPRHKELFNEGYYDGEPGDVDEQDLFESPISKMMNKQGRLYQDDALDMDINNKQTSLDIEGGIMQNYRKLRGQTVEEVLDSDYWDAKKQMTHNAAKMFNP